MRIGIQGGKGSFNHQAVLHYIEKENIKDFEIIFLYTTKNVLEALEREEIDLGQFAISNTLGGLVQETLDQIGKFRFEVIDNFKIQIRHFLMRLPNIEIDSLMAHPQVFVQCASNLLQKYPQLPQVVGEGELIDTAKAAQALSEGKISKTTGILGPKTLAELYNFEIIDSDLQDNKENFTSFLIVK